MAISAEKTSWRWQLAQFQQHLVEWLEVKLRSADRDSSLDIFPAWLGEFLVRLTWLVLAGLVIWVGYRIVYPYWQKWLSKNKQQQSVDRSIVEQIYTAAELLDRSRQFQLDENYTEASRWLYLAMLQLLNDAKFIPHLPSRTDREYVKILRTVPNIQSGELLVSIHERFYFGNEIVTAEDFDRCQQVYREIEMSVTQSMRR
jgi:Domain of unknown function (DUF4129)